MNNTIIIIYFECQIDISLSETIKFCAFLYLTIKNKLSFEVSIYDLLQYISHLCSFKTSICF
jgi:hypothetical protein